MRRLRIDLSDQVFGELVGRAARERRDVREQAAWLIERLLAHGEDGHGADTGATPENAIAVSCTNS